MDNQIKSNQIKRQRKPSHPLFPIPIVSDCSLGDNAGESITQVVEAKVQYHVSWVE
jgi:hypothetical protein